MSVTSRNRLPTLAECLKRNTRPPVDLYCFYLFLQREGAEDTLDFWLDVQQHENLCRAYFTDLLKTANLDPATTSSRESAREIEHDWPRYAHYARTRGSIYNRYTGIDQNDHPSTSSQGHESLSGGGEKEWRGGQLSGYEQEIDRDDDSPPIEHEPTNPYPISPNLALLYPREQQDSAFPHRRATSPFQRRRSTGPTTTEPIIRRREKDMAISRSDLISSAERIYSRYLMPGAEKEIYLPSDLRLASFGPSSSTLPPTNHPSYESEALAQAEVPDLFHRQKEFVYTILKEESFPRFLRAKGFGNLTRMSAVVRLAVGLMSLWVGLSTAFAFIFLATEPRSTRLWIILPFTVAIFNIMAFLYDLDVILVFMGLSETTPFHTIGIKEPYVRKILFGRALYVTGISSVIVAALTLLFYFVPSHHL